MKKLRWKAIPFLLFLMTTGSVIVGAGDVGVQAIELEQKGNSWKIGTILSASVKDQVAYTIIIERERNGIRSDSRSYEITIYGISTNCPNDCGYCGACILNILGWRKWDVIGFCGKALGPCPPPYTDVCSGYCDSVLSGPEMTTNNLRSGDKIVVTIIPDAGTVDGDHSNNVLTVDIAE